MSLKRNFEPTSSETLVVLKISEFVKKELIEFCTSKFLFVKFAVKLRAAQQM